MPGPATAPSPINSSRPLDPGIDRAQLTAEAEQECNDELARLFDSVAPWFCETKRETANALMQELHARSGSISNFDLIEKFYALKNLAGADYQGRFQRSNIHDRFAYSIALDDAESKIFHFEVELKSTPPISSSSLKMYLAAGSVVAGLGAVSYFRPDLSVAGIGLLSRAASAALKDAYGSALEWKDFALSISYPQKAASVLNLAAARLSNGAESLKAGANCIQDSACAYNVAANGCTYAKNKAIEVFWGQMTFKVVGVVWGKLSSLLLPPPSAPAAAAAQPAPQSTALWLVNMLGFTYTYSGVFYVYEFFKEALSEPAPVTG
ncbi:hypothetical protein [Ottowia sp. VDI28]|uniref:hypothetical protein n=1 Tax=Ottowia sp. VDI28 TaxID=3133968 RepID=UPI003C2F2883